MTVSFQSRPTSEYFLDLLIQWKAMTYRMLLIVVYFLMLYSRQAMHSACGWLLIDRLLILLDCSLAIARASQGATWSWCSLSALSICRACRPSDDKKISESDRCFGSERWKTYRSHVYRAGTQEGVSGRRGLAECTRRSCDGCQVDCGRNSGSVSVKTAKTFGQD
jgi:hypothetical protein